MKEYRDFYFRKAKAENYPARSVYKLQELDSKFRLLRQGSKAVDLGGAPGSWSLWSAGKIGSSGLLLTCDIHPLTVALPPHARFFQEDVFLAAGEFGRALAETGPFDIFLSDMAPATTGNKFTDQCRSLDLARRAFDLASRWLKPGGDLVVKIFQGPDVPAFRNELRQEFARVSAFKPKSSRAESKEDFLVCQGLRSKN